MPWLETLARNGRLDLLWQVGNVIYRYSACPDIKRFRYLQDISFQNTLGFKIWPQSGYVYPFRSCFSLPLLVHQKYGGWFPGISHISTWFVSTKWTPVVGQFHQPNRKQTSFSGKISSCLRNMEEASALTCTPTQKSTPSVDLPAWPKWYLTHGPDMERAECVIFAFLLP